MICLENEILYGVTGEVPDIEDWLVPIGKARIARPGQDVTIVSFSRGMTYALEAAGEAGRRGVSSRGDRFKISASNRL